MRRSPAYLLLSLVVLLAVVAAGFVFSRATQDDSPLEAALKTLPADTLTANFTGWAAARAELAPEVDSGSGVQAKEAFLDRAYERDLSAVSLLAVFEGPMRATFGWSVLDTEWEMYGQSREGAVAVLKMADDFDFDQAAATLSKLGYPKADADGVRAGGADLLARVMPGGTPQLANIALLPAEGLVVTSDRAEYAGRAVAAVDDSGDSVYDEAGVAEMVGPLLDGTASAVVHVGERGCVVTGFQQASPEARRLARQRIAEAGGLNRLSGLTLSLDERGRLTVVMRLDGRAGDDRDARLELARGEAPSQGGTFEDKFTVSAVAVEGDNLLMTLRPPTVDSQLLSDLGRGGLVFASC